MKLLFCVENQKISAVNQKHVAADSIDYLSCKFVFSDDWNGCEKTAVFGGIGGTYSVLLENGECTVPHEVIDTRFSVSVYGVKDGMRITTDCVYISVQKSGYKEGETPEPPTPTVYEQLLGRLDGVQGNIDNYEIPDKSVTAEKIADYAVGTQQIAQGAVNNRRIINGAVDMRTLAEDVKAEFAKAADLEAEQAAREMALTEHESGFNHPDGSVTMSKIADSAVDSQKIKDNSVTLAKLADEVMGEVDSKIAEAKSIIPKRYLVAELPTENIDTNGTYLVPAETPNENNIYTEYAYINGAWEIIGSPFEVDLSDYYTKSETYNMLEKKLDKDTTIVTADASQELFDLLSGACDWNRVLGPETMSRVSDVEHDILDKSDKTTITAETASSITMTHNTEYRYGEAAELTLTLPDTLPDDYISSVVFTSGETATALIYPDTVKMSGDDCIDGVFAPVANKRYTVIVSYDGVYVSGIAGGVAV